MSSITFIPPQTSTSRNSPAIHPTLDDQENDPHHTKALFQKVLSALTPENDQPKPNLKEIVDILSIDQDVLLTLYQVPNDKIKEAFKKHLQNCREYQPQKKQALKILSHLYEIALFNSSLQAQLAQTANELPNIKKRSSDDSFKELRTLMRDARPLRKEAAHCSTLEQVQAVIPKIEKVLPELNEFRRLKQYQDENDNQRLVDLAGYVKKQRALQQYPQIETSYLPIVKRLAVHSQDINAASSLLSQLQAEKLRLQQVKASALKKEDSTNPLETRFLNGFSVPFYHAFATHFWALLWQSMEDPEIKGIITTLPDFQKLKADEVSIEHLYLIWAKYLPETSFEEWMVKSLESIDPKELDSLEASLQEKTKSLNQIQENPQLNSVLKQQMKAPLSKEMETLCTTVTKPSFATLAELKSFLSNS